MVARNESKETRISVGAVSEDFGAFLVHEELPINISRVQLAAPTQFLRGSCMMYPMAITVI